MTCSSSRAWTLAGLAIALFGIPAIVTAQRLLSADATAAGPVIAREIAILALTAFLLWIVMSPERQPLSSIGFRMDRIGRSLGWGFGLAVVCFVAVVACLWLYSALGMHYGEATGISRALPVTLLAVVRAGISEEVFYRGFAIERLQSLTGSKWLAAAITLAAFAGFHFRQGAAGIILALVLGAIITGFYLWRRDLVAAMFAHFLVDFIPNVVLPALGGGN
nr:CPBP family intramembrane metalloprotease [Sphingomonas sp.]